MRYCGRDFSPLELARIRQLIAKHPSSTRAELARLTCQALAWRKPDGGLKAMSCRVAMLRMQADGLLELPPPRHPRPLIRIGNTARTAPGPLIDQPVHALPELHLQPVEQTTSGLWNEFIHRYHYLGYTPLPGAQQRYFAYSGSTPLALLGFGAAAWQCAPRDRFIGWTPEQRQRHLPLIVNNARFLIFPWVQSPNLASKLLAMAARRLPSDWQQRYGYRPVLLESFVETERFTGTCYKAANWRYLGQTQGRGKLGPRGRQSVPIKDLWVYPLEARFRDHLTR